MRFAWLVVALGCGSPKPPPAAAPPHPPPPAELAPPPVAEPEKPAEEQVAESDPCQGGEATGEGTIGIGSIGIGGGGSTGRGTGTGGYGGPKDRKTSVVLGAQTVEGAIDKEIIRRVVRQHMAAITYCFEKAAVDNPHVLDSKTVVTWTIGPDGKVTDATVQGLDPAADTCIETQIKRWVFPKPKGGGSVKVTYPFVFKRS